MIEGDIALTKLPQADGEIKVRPVVVLKKMPPFGDWLVSGISTQLNQEVPGFDDLIEPSHSDFAGSGFKAASLIRLGFLLVIPSRRLLGRIGSISDKRLRRLQQRLSAFVAPNSP